MQPGDELQLKIVRDGKESHQGVGYLEDGTMVVVDGAHGRSGERLPVVVTGALQTPTGRMVFARLEGYESPEAASAGPVRKGKSAPKRSNRSDQDPANPR